MLLKDLISDDPGQAWPAACIAAATNLSAMGTMRASCDRIRRYSIIKES